MIGLRLSGRCKDRSEMDRHKRLCEENSPSEGPALGRMGMKSHWQSCESHGWAFIVGSEGVQLTLCNRPWVPRLISIFTNASKMLLGSEQMPI